MVLLTKNRRSNHHQAPMVVTTTTTTSTTPAVAAAAAAASTQQPRPVTPDDNNNNHEALSPFNNSDNSWIAFPRTRTKRRPQFWLVRRLVGKQDDSLLKQQQQQHHTHEVELLSTAWDPSSSLEAVGDDNVLCFDDDDEASRSSSLSSSSASSLSTVTELRQRREDQLLILQQEEPPQELLKDNHQAQQRRRPGSRLQVWLRRPKIIKSIKQQELDLQAYMAQREMTRTQERWNALTMIPSPLYCIYYIHAGLWKMDTDLNTTMTSEQPLLDTADLSCLSSSSLFDSPSMPPLPVLAAAAGIVLHAPCSMLYHWKYAHTLPAGAPRTEHWSRRLDQCMIHVASALMSYACSGSWDVLVANALFNIDCIWKQCQPKVKPRRNQARIFLSFVFYTLPLLTNTAGVMEFVLFWTIMGISGWLFSQYPLGGWSHAAFHLVSALAPPIILHVATELPMSQEQRLWAAQCAAVAVVAGV